jgi:chromosome partitioning protein
VSAAPKPAGPLRLAVTAHKGGVGKTTIAVNLAAACAETGRRTLLVDVDPQGAATDGLAVVASPPSLYDVLMGQATAAEAIVHSVLENLDVLAADLDLAGADITLPRLPNWQTRLRDALASAAGAYQVVVFDTGPGRGVLPFAAVVASDRVVIAATPAYLSLRGLRHVVDTIAQAEQFNPALQVVGIVPSIVGPRTLQRDEALAQIEKRWPGWTLPALPRRVALEEATAAGQPITTYSPKSASAAAVRALTQEVLARASA